MGLRDLSCRTGDIGASARPPWRFAFVLGPSAAILGRLCPLLALLTRTDGCTEAHIISCSNPKASVPLLALLACTGGCIKIHNIWQQELVHHLLQQSKGFLLQLAFLTRTNSCIDAHMR